MDALDSSESKESPPRLVKTLHKGARRKEVIGFVATVEHVNGALVSHHQTISGATINRGLAPSKPPTTLSNPTCRGKDAARKLDVESRVPKIMMPSVIADVQPQRLLLRDQVPRQDESARKDTGPWSREAFDLFDWKPPVIQQPMAQR